MSMLILAKVLGSDCCFSSILRGVMQTWAVTLDGVFRPPLLLRWPLGTGFLLAAGVVLRK